MYNAISKAIHPSKLISVSSVRDQQPQSQRFLHLETPPLEQHPPSKIWGPCTNLTRAEIRRVPAQKRKVCGGISAAAVSTERLSPLSFYVTAAEKRRSRYAYRCSKTDFITCVLR